MNLVSRKYLLIHGAYHGAWCWEEVKALLETRENIVYTLDLPGHGQDKTNREGVTLQLYIDNVEKFIIDNNLTDLIIVAHSFAGVISTKLIERIPDRINKIIFISAIILDNGECFFDYFVPEVRDRYIELAKRENGAIPPNHDSLRSRLFNELDDDVKYEAIFSKLTPQPIKPYIEKIYLKNFNNSKIPMVYLFLTNDVSLPVESFMEMISKLPTSFKKVEIDSDHEIMFSHPQLLTDSIIINS
jgi:pimeloyl-ACP methyl ester carboxylesterase